jgi:hypothetical protein
MKGYDFWIGRDPDTNEIEFIQFMIKEQRERLAITFEIAAKVLRAKVARPVIAYCELVQKEDHQLWMIPACPYCGEKHYHGAGYRGEDPNRYLGHRESHCATEPKPREGYVLSSMVKV